MALDPKKMAMLVLSKGKPKGDAPDDKPDSLDGSDEPSDGAVSAMEDFIAAVKAEDAKAACKAMEAYSHMDSDEA